MLLFPDARREIERVDIAARAAVAEAQRPELVDLDPVAGFVLERAEECAGRRIEGVNARITFAEVADEQRVAENAEARGRNCNSPRRIERAVVDAKGQVADAVRVKAPDETV